MQKKMHNFRPDHGPTVDKPWNDLSRAWNGLWTGVWEFSTDFIFSATAKFWILPPKKGNKLDFNLDTLDGARIQKQKVLRLWNILGPYSGLFLQYMFRSLGRNLLFLIGLMTYDGIDRLWTCVFCPATAWCFLMFHLRPIGNSKTNHKDWNL